MLRVKRLARKGAGDVLAGGTKQIKRTPEIIEAEFANLLTVSMLVFFVMLTLPGSVDHEQISKWCDPEGKGNDSCAGRAFYWVGQFICVAMSGICFLLSSFLLISYRLLHILPDELAECDIFFHQYQEEIFAAYFLLLGSMFVGMWPVAVLYYIQYTNYAIVLVGSPAAFVSFFLLYWFPKEHMQALEKIKSHRQAEAGLKMGTANPLAVEVDTETMEDALKATNLTFVKYLSKFQDAQIQPIQLAILTTSDLVGTLDIPLGDALRMVESFKTRRWNRS